jgi:hypothetical protein
VGIEELA